MADQRASWTTIAALGALGFCALASYGFARPAVESMFLGRYGSAALPKVWLAVGVAVFVVVTVYNRFAARTHPSTLFAGSALISAALLALLLLARRAGFSHADFALSPSSTSGAGVVVAVFNNCGLLIGDRLVDWILLPLGAASRVWC